MGTNQYDPRTESLAEFIQRVRRQDEAHGGIRHRRGAVGECAECDEGTEHASTEQ